MGNIHANAFIFSPTGSASRIAYAILDGNGEVADLVAQTKPRSFHPGNAVIVAVPVFGGRVPTVALEHIRLLAGNGAFAAAVVVYGNRAFDDALLELNTALEQQGFHVIGAAAFVARHSMAPSIAAGRPDENDLSAAAAFGQSFFKKLERIAAGEPCSLLSVPGSTPYRAYNGVPFRPSANRKCVACGLCARECPVGAIPVARPSKTQKDRCISCMHCAEVCPKGARRLGWLQGKLVEKKLSGMCRAAKQPDVFL